MSITFFADNGPVIGYAVTDRAGGREEFGLDDYDAAGARLVAVRDHDAVLAGSQPSGEEWELPYLQHHPVLEYLTATTSPDVNMGSGHAVTVLEMLGVTVDRNDEVCGEMDAQDFLARVMLAQALCLEDAGVPGYAATPRHTVGGRQPGYYPRKLAELRELAEWAIAHERKEVYWS